MLPTESNIHEWQPIKWYEWLYLIHISGAIVSLPKKWASWTMTPLKTSIDRWWYLRTYLCKDGEKKTVRVHRLVWFTFKEPEPWKLFLWHLDNNKQNPHVDNLYWTTNQENIQHAYRDGLCKIFPKGNPNEWKFGSESRFAKRVGKFDKMNNLIESYESLIDAESSTKVSRQCISWVCRWVHKTAWGFIWKFL